jgi:hypothetical protein
MRQTLHCLSLFFVGWRHILRLFEAEIRLHFLLTDILPSATILMS